MSPALKKTPPEHLLKHVNHQYIKKCRSILRLERSVFLKNLEKFFLYIFVFLLKRSFQGIFSCFEIVIEVPKFKKNALNCAITVIKVHDPLLTLLQVITMLAT